MYLLFMNVLLKATQSIAIVGVLPTLRDTLLCRRSFVFEYDYNETLIARICITVII